MHVALALALAISASAQAEGAPPPSPSERLAQDAPRATPGGTTFTAPSGWSLTTRARAVLLEPPEGDSRVALVDVEAKDADAAVAAAWATYRPEARRPLRVATPRAPEDGWEERRVFEYETSPNERAVVYAIAMRAGAAWTVAIVEASEPTFEKRGGPFRLALRSLRPKGYARETFTTRKANPLTAARVAELTRFLAEGMRLLDVPGVAFSLVDRGRIVHAGGLGVRELGKPELVDADTLFIAASNTKGLTTLMLAKLVDEGKLRWDQPVTEVYPGFHLGDSATTAQVRVSHLVCACTGLPRQDLEWLFEYGQQTPATSMALLATMQPTSRFGEVFQYSNLMASAAGYIGGHVLDPGRELGAAYDEAMRRKVFEPLGMRSTTFDFARALRGNHASPHGEDPDARTLVARMDLNYAVVPHRPAGGVWTSARDLTRYVQMELAHGKLPGGKRFISEKNLQARQAPQVVVSADVTYGMGLMVDRRWGIPVVHHGGDLAGYHSDMIFLPEHGVGAVLLTNSDAGWRLRGPFLRRLVEVLFDGRPEAAGQLAAAAAERKAVLAKARERLMIPPDASEAGKLAARYVSPALGTLAVREERGATVFDFGEWHSAVASRRNDDGTISFITIDPTAEGLEFVVSERNGQRALVIRDAQHEYAFVEAKST